MERLNPHNGGNVGYRLLNSQQQYVIPGLVCLMVAIALERITFYIVTDNITNFFVNVVKLNESNVAVNTFLVFSGTSNFFPLFGGILGDSMISRYVCTLTGFLTEAVGSVFLLVLLIIMDKAPELTTNRELVYGMVFTGLSLMAIGLGLYRANILTLGCEQLGQQTDQTKNVKAVEKFFRGYYWVTNVGALVAHSILSVTDSSQVVSKQVPSYYLGIAQTVTIVLGAFFIIVGKRWYIRTSPDGHNLRKLRRSIFRKLTFVYRYFRRKRDDFTLSSQLSEQRDEDEVSTHIFKIILVTSSLVMFGIIYFLETGDIFFNQGRKMDDTVNWNETIPLQIILGFDSFTIIVVLPIIHFLITPFLTIPLLEKMGLGLLAGCGSALTCGIVEAVRLNYYRTCSHTCVSIFWQVPQFVFLSLAEIFVIITNLQFGYCESPPNMEGLVLGIGFCLLGLGSYMARFLIWIVDAAQASWYPSDGDFDKGEVWKFLFFLAGMQLFFLFIFTWHAYHYQYKYSYKETEDSSVSSPLLRGPVQSEMTYASIGSASVNSLDSLASLRSGEH